VISVGACASMKPGNNRVKVARSRTGRDRRPSANSVDAIVRNQNPSGRLDRSAVAVEQRGGFQHDYPGFVWLPSYRTRWLRGSPRWSPDGRRIVFYRSKPLLIGLPASQFSIFGGVLSRLHSVKPFFAGKTSVFPSFDAASRLTFSSAAPAGSQLANCSNSSDQWGIVLNSADSVESRQPDVGLPQFRGPT
jgi:hypothetical protein